MERMESDRIAKIVYVGKCVGSRSVGKLKKIWTHTVKDGLRKRGLDVRQAKRIVQDRSKWQGFVRGNARSVALEINP